MNNLQIDKIIDTVDVEKSQIVYIFLMGSRLWGSAREDSDYDLLVVCETPQDQQQIHKSVHTYNADIVIMDYLTFIGKIENHEFIETVCCFTPEENRLLSQRPLKKPKIDPEAMRKSINYRMTRDIAYANKNEAKGKVTRASKTRFHALVTLAIGNQLIQDGNITDFSAAAHYRDIFWSREEFEPVYQELLARID